MLTLVLERIGVVRWDTAAERRVPGVLGMALLIIAGACLTGLMAQIRVYLPGTEIPLTGQVLAVLLCGTLLGSYGVLSQIIYVGAGMAGVPWFAGGAAGFVYASGTTGGYLIGFIVAAGILGICTRCSSRFRTLGGQFTLMLIGVVVIHAFGVLYRMLMGMPAGVAVLTGTAPFIVADVIKALMAAMLTSAVLPRSSRSQ